MNRRIRIQRQLVCALGAGLLSVACSGSDEPEVAPKPLISVFDQRPTPEATEDERVEIGSTRRAQVRDAQNQRTQQPGARRCSRKTRTVMTSRSNRAERPRL